MRLWLFAALLAMTGSLTGLAQATPPGIHKVTVQAPIQATYDAVYAALEEARFWVVFEANILKNISRFEAKWGEDFNQNKLDAIRSLAVCNGWFANQVGNSDPDLLALCPLRLSLIHKDGVTSVLFAKPSMAAAGSPGIATVRTIEQQIIEAIAAGVAKVETK